MTVIKTELSRWQAGARAHREPGRADDLLQEADRQALAEIRARQAANRNTMYNKRRPSRYANANYQVLTPEQNPRRMVSTWLTRGPRALLLAGPARTGKTTAAYAIANDAHSAGDWVMVWTAAGLSAALKPDGEPLAYQYAVTCDILMLDDLGRERVTDWWLEQLQRIVDERCAHQRRLIVTTNSPAGAPEAAYTSLVERYGDPIVERLIDGGGIVVLDGPAHREVVTDW